MPVIFLLCSPLFCPSVSPMSLTTFSSRPLTIKLGWLNTLLSLSIHPPLHFFLSSALSWSVSPVLSAPPASNNAGASWSWYITSGRPLLRPTYACASAASLTYSRTFQTSTFSPHSSHSTTFVLSRLVPSPSPSSDACLDIILGSPTLLTTSSPVVPPEAAQVAGSAHCRQDESHHLVASASHARAFGS